MEVRDVASNLKGVLETSARKHADSKTTKAPEMNFSDKSAPKTDVVELSGGKGPVVEKQGANVKLPDELDKAKEQEQKAEVGASVRRDYSVEDGNLVVRFIDTEANRVIKEIPAEEMRRIKEAISRFQENDGHKTTPVEQNETPVDEENDQAGEEPKEIDVTS